MQKKKIIASQISHSFTKSLVKFYYLREPKRIKIKIVIPSDVTRQ